MIIINFKNYKLGKKALALAKEIEKYLPHAIICPAAIDIEECSRKTNLKVFAQSADPIDSERATGFNTLKAIKEAGAKGILINHSEHPLPYSKIKKAEHSKSPSLRKEAVLAETLSKLKKKKKRKRRKN